LLTLMAEDLADVEEAAIETLVANLLATQEAAGPRAQPRREGIATVFELRRLAIRALVPEAADRRRYARTGVSAAGAIALDLQLAAVDTLLNESPEMTPEALQALIEAACAAPELAGVSASQATMIAWAWMQRGSYADVLASVPGRFDSIDEAVKYVEQTISYALPWVLNGLLRLLDPEKEAEDPMVIRFPKPAWASYLPQFLRYGVNEPDLVWIMSLGIPDPTFAAWIREQFEEARGRRPESFRDVLGWAVDNQRALAEAASEWPRYFVRLLLDVLSRYAQVRTLLDGA
jgi:hypothetical protein